MPYENGDGSSGSGDGNMSAEELIKNGKAKDGDTVRLLWRNELTTPFSDGICFGEDGKASDRASRPSRQSA